MRYGHAPSHPDDLGIKLRYVLRKLRMSSGWPLARSISHPDEILPIARSSGWLCVQVSLCHPDDLLHNGSVCFTHMIPRITHTLTLHFTGPLWGEPNRNAVLWYLCGYTGQVVEQIIKVSVSSDAMELMWCQCNNRERHRYVRKTETNEHGNTIIQVKC